jgi:hypothetical protein
MTDQTGVVTIPLSPRVEDEDEDAAERQKPWTDGRPIHYCLSIPTATTRRSD